MLSISHWLVRVGNEINFSKSSLNNQYAFCNNTRFTISFIKEHKENDVIWFSETHKPNYIIGIAKIKFIENIKSNFIIHYSDYVYLYNHNIKIISSASSFVLSFVKLNKNEHNHLKIYTDIQNDLINKYKEHLNSNQEISKQKRKINEISMISSSIQHNISNQEEIIDLSLKLSKPREYKKSNITITKNDEEYVIKITIEK